MGNDAHETRRARGLLLVTAVLLIGVGVALWRFSPLADVFAAERLAAWFTRFGQSRWAPAAVIGLYVAAGLVVFPLLLLIAATAVVFEPLTAFVVSLCGSLANAMVLYFIGARLARRSMQAALGDSLGRIRAMLRNRGVLAIALLRSVPVAPFTIVNLAAGSIGVPPREYLLGTALGLAPGIVLMTAFGNRLRSLWDTPTPGNVAMLAGIAAAWLATVVILQRVASRVRTQAPRATSRS